jgi:uncharacterized protein (TIGR03663 family)
MRKSLFWAILVATFLSRFLCLDNKPIHFDESINGWFLLQMKTIGFYKYDPQNYHGPLYFYLLQAWTAVFAESLLAMRSLTGLFSAAAVLFFIRRSPWTSFFLLVSPSLIFFGRSAINESVFVFSQILFFVGIYEYQKEQRLNSLWWALIGFLGMASLKETFVFTGMATVLALLVGFPWKSFVKDMWGPMRGPILFVIVAIGILFTGLGQNLTGAFDFFRAFTYWTSTGIESGHNKSFWYWTEIAVQTEPLLLLAGIVSLLCLFHKKYRTLSVFALSGWLLYSVVPYKTPWCFISLAWPFYYLLGEFFGDLEKYEKCWRIILYTLTVLLVGLGAKSAWVSVYQYPIDLEHPFVYVNSTYDFKKIDEFIQKNLREQPELKKQTIQISLDETWPIPWTLHESDGLRYDRLADLIHPNALVYFCELTEESLLGETVLDHYHGISVPVRQFGRTIRIYLRKDIFMELP